MTNRDWDHIPAHERRMTNNFLYNCSSTPTPPAEGTRRRQQPRETPVPPPVKQPAHSALGAAIPVTSRTPPRKITLIENHQ